MNVTKNVTAPSSANRFQAAEQAATIRAPKLPEIGSCRDCSSVSVSPGIPQEDRDRSNSPYTGRLGGQRRSYSPYTDQPAQAASLEAREDRDGAAVPTYADTSVDPHRRVGQGKSRSSPYAWEQAGNTRALGAIPTSDLTQQYRSIKGEIDDAVSRVLAGGEFERGEELWALERELAAYLDVRHVVPVGSGYAALFLALRALGVGPGDEVITVANTDITTCSAITHCGANIVWVDVEERTFTIYPELSHEAVHEVAAALRLALEDCSTKGA